MNDSPAAAPTASPRVTFLQRRLIVPIVGQLRQGMTPEKIALTVALGVALGIFPILGSSTLLCTAAALLLRLNQPIIQAVNYFAYPLQLLLLIPFYRAGEAIFHQPQTPLSIPLLFARFHADVRQFLRDFGLIALEGIFVWCLIAPFLVAILSMALRPPLRALKRRAAH